MQLTSPHFLSGSPRQLCMAFSDIGMKFISNIRSLLTKKFSDYASLVESAKQVHLCPIPPKLRSWEARWTNIKLSHYPQITTLSKYFLLSHLWHRMCISAHHTEPYPLALNLTYDVVYERILVAIQKNIQNFSAKVSPE